MKVNLKIVCAGKFNDDQEQILRRIQLVLIEHGLSVKCERKVKLNNVNLRRVC
jgi:hypothetical protein